MRRQTESGAIVCKRVGMQNFIFSAKSPSENEYYDEMPSEFPYVLIVNWVIYVRLE